MQPLREGKRLGTVINPLPLGANPGGEFDDSVLRNCERNGDRVACGIEPLEPRAVRT